MLKNWNASLFSDAGNKKIIRIIKVKKSHNEVVKDRNHEETSHLKQITMVCFLNVFISLSEGELLNGCLIRIKTNPNGIIYCNCLTLFILGLYTLLKFWLNCPCFLIFSLVVEYLP